MHPRRPHPLSFRRQLDRLLLLLGGDGVVIAAGSVKLVDNDEWL